MKSIISNMCFTWIFLLPYICFGHGSGLATKFDEFNDYIDFGSVDFGFEKSASFTAWVRIDELICESRVNILSNNSSENINDGQFWIQFEPRDSTIRFWVNEVTYYGTRIESLKSLTKPVRGEWIHLACVYHSEELRSTLEIYLNGIRDNYAIGFAGSVKEHDLEYIMKIGQNVTGSFTGVTDELTIWDKNLSQIEIRELMCKKLSGKERNLTGYWRFDEEEGNIIYDHSLNGNNGVMFGTKRINSGAPVGDSSIYTYPESWNGISIQIAHSDGDRMFIHNVNGSPTGIHLYRVDDAPLVAIPPLGWDKVDPLRYWGVFVVGASNSLYDMVYNYNGHPGIIPKFESELGLAYRENGEDKHWKNTNASLNIETNTLSLMNQSGTEYILMDHYGNNPLPITLTDFTAIVYLKMIELSWTTHGEAENSYFNILRSKSMSMSFDVLKHVPGNGASPNLRVYHYKDYDVEPGEDYWYKVVMVTDGNTAEFGPIKAQSTQFTEYKELKIYSYPNPFSSSIRIALSFPGIEDVEGTRHFDLEIYDIQGRIVRNLSVSTENMCRNESIIWYGRDDNGRKVSNGYFYCLLKTGKKIYKSGKFVFLGKKDH
jgi:hypothetical protein